MAYTYTINSVDISNSSFVIQFTGLNPMNCKIPNDGTNYLTGVELDSAIQLLYPQVDLIACNNGYEIEDLVTINIPTATDNQNKAVVLLIATDWVECPSVTDATRTPYLTNQYDFISYRNVIRGIAVTPVEGNLVWATKPTEQWIS